MRFQTNTPLVDEYGDQISVPKSRVGRAAAVGEQEYVPLILGYLVSNCLLHNGEDSQAEDKMRDYSLAMSIMKEDFFELSASEVARVQDAIAKRYIPLIAGQAIGMLERPVSEGSVS